MRTIARPSAAAVLIATAALAADSPLAIDPGLWKMNMTMTLSGALPAGLQQLPAEQRAAAERGWREHTARPITTEVQECLTAEDIRAANLLDAEAGCKRTVAKATASEWTVSETCRTDQGTRVMNFTARARSRTRLEMRGTMVESGEDGERRGTMSVDAQWLAARCPAEP